MSLNIEELSMAKCEFLERLLGEHRVIVLAVKESHMANGAPSSRYVISGYTLVSRVNHKQ